MIHINRASDIGDKKYMKKIIWLVFFFFFLFACNTNDNSTKTNITDSKTTTIENLDLELTYEITNNEIIITGFSGLSTLLYIPNQIEDYPVIAIQDSAFLDAAQFVNVILPENLKSIGENSFKNAISLEAIIIPDNVQTIGRWAFEHCVSLKSVEIGEGVTEIKLSTFRDCVLLETIILPKSLLIIDDEAFSGCTSLISIELPDSLSTIGRRAFSNCISLTNIYVPDSVITMDEDVFYNCSKLMLYLTLNEIPNTWNRDWNSYSCLIVNIEDMITISFETNGGSYVNNIYTFFGASIYIPQTLCKTDNIFMGWYLDSTLSTPYTSTTAPNENIKLYARWIQSNDYDDILINLLEKKNELLADATEESKTLLISIYENSITEVINALNRDEALSKYDTFIEQLTMNFERDYNRVDLGYAKLSATNLMETSLNSLQMFVQYQIWQSFEPKLVLMQYIIDIHQASTIESVDFLLESFIEDMASAIENEGTPPNELIIGFKQASLGTLNMVYETINQQSLNDLGLEVLEYEVNNTFSTDISLTDSIPDITKIVFYGIRDMFQTISNESITIYKTRIENLYQETKPTIQVVNLDVFDSVYNKYLNLIQSMQFYETKRQAYLDYLSYLDRL